MVPCLQIRSDLALCINIGFVSCQVSDPGGGAVNPLHGPGGDAAGKFGPKSRCASGNRGHPGARSRDTHIAEVEQADQDELSAGTNSMAVTVTPSELRQARVIGQVTIRIL